MLDIAAGLSFVVLASPGEITIIVRQTQSWTADLAGRITTKTNIIHSQ
jgi:hypothetical protein